MLDGADAYVPPLSRTITLEGELDAPTKLPWCRPRDCIGEVSLQHALQVIVVGQVLAPKHHTQAPHTRRGKGNLGVQQRIWLLLNTVVGVEEIPGIVVAAYVQSEPT